MRTIIAFVKKEWLAHIRSDQILILTILFTIFGIINPATAKLTPKLLELAKKSLASSGLHVTSVHITALDSWTQFFKNSLIVLVIFLVVEGDIFTKEYQSGTLIIAITKGLKRKKVILSKVAILFATWTGGYWLSFIITYAYNAYYWDNSIVPNVIIAGFSMWLLGIFILTTFTTFSVILKTNTSVLLGTGLSALLLYLLSFLPKIKQFSPLSLGNGNQLIAGTMEASTLYGPIFVSAFLSTICLIISVLLFNKKQF